LPNDIATAGWQPAELSTHFLSLSLALLNNFALQNCKPDQGLHFTGRALAFLNI
jgi:hypothetical protein